MRLVQGYRAASARERIGFNMAGATAVTIGAARVVNALRSQTPVRDALRRRIGGQRHVHHYVPGIALALSSGALGLIARDARWEAALALPFGTGVGLTLDEAAMLFEFQNHYWKPEQVPVVEGVLAAATAMALGVRFVRRRAAGDG